MALARCAVALASLTIAGCGGASPGLDALAQPGAIGYQASNAFSPNGFSESLLGPNQYRVRAIGNVENSRAELEKLALTRAADIGQSQNLKFFRVDGVSENITCGSKKMLASKEPREMVQKARRMVDVDVTFAKEAPDSAWQNSKESFAALRSELDTLAPPAGARDAAREEVRQKCGV